MSRGIKVSEKHGLNPCIPICFWCGNEKNEVALLGKLTGDREAPMSAVLDYEPCPDCKSIMDQGIVIIEAEPTSSRANIPAFHGSYPTGRWVVVKRDAVPEQYKQNKIMFMLPDQFSNLIARSEA